MALIEAKMRRAPIFQLAWIFRVSDFFSGCKNVGFNVENLIIDSQHLVRII